GLTGPERLDGTDLEVVQRERVAFGEFRETRHLPISLGVAASSAVATPLWRVGDGSSHARRHTPRPLRPHRSAGPGGWRRGGRTGPGRARRCHREGCTPPGRATSLAESGLFLSRDARRRPTAAFPTAPHTPGHGRS